MSRKTPPAENREEALIEASADVDAFLATVANKAPAKRSGGTTTGRLIFAMDATASRQPSWDRAMALQSQMFMGTRGIGELEVQLVYYRGYRECRSSRWVRNPAAVVSLMSKINCVAGRTQIKRVLEHALAETRENPVQAMVFVGDAAEEPIDPLGDLAGRLKITGLPVFIFQEGTDANASRAFSSIASLSGGAHCQLNENSASDLGDLLSAVAAYAAGGKQALARLSAHSTSAVQLLEQLG